MIDVREASRFMSDDNEDLQRHDLRSFGRRRGRKRSARQDRIFKHGLKHWGIAPSGLAEIAPQEFFATAPEQIWLEIGFGGGEHLIWQAEHNPHVGLIGAEPFEDGVVKVLTAIEEKQLQNVRVLPADVRRLIRQFSSESIARAFILFPDPWPKARHAKRRLISPHLLDALGRVLSHGAELRVATDIAHYAASIMQAVHCHPEFVWEVNRPQDWRTRPADWPATRYEGKARRAGRQPYFFQFRHLKPGKPIPGA